jgi:hypothetical protein
MASALLLPIKKNVLTASAVAATASSAAFSLPMADSYDLVLNITSVTGTTPTMDLVLQTSIDGGTTFVDLPLRYTQKTAAGVAHLVFRLGLGENEVALEQAGADTGGTLAKNCVFDPQNMKLKYTIGGTNPTFTFTVTAFALPLGWKK